MGIEKLIAGDIQRKEKGIIQSCGQKITYIPFLARLSTDCQMQTASDSLASLLLRNQIALLLTIITFLISLGLPSQVV